MMVMPMSSDEKPVLDRATQIALFPHTDLTFGSPDSWMNWDPEHEQRRWAARIERQKVFSSAARAVGATSVADALAKGVEFPPMDHDPDAVNPEARAELEEFLRRYDPGLLQEL